MGEAQGFYVTLHVKSCEKCLLRHRHFGHGEFWDECRHPNNPGGWDNIINDYTGLFPPFCPGMKGDANG